MKTPLVIALVAAISAAGAYLYFAGRQHGADAVMLQWEQERVVLSEQNNNALKQALEKQQQLQHRIVVATLEHQRETETITRKYNDAINSLRRRPIERATSAAGLPESSSVGVGCTGAGLARDDAEFLTRYAADAAKLQSAYNTCKAAYDALTIIEEQDNNK